MPMLKRALPFSSFSAAKDDSDNGEGSDKLGSSSRGESGMLASIFSQLSVL